MTVKRIYVEILYQFFSLRIASDFLVHYAPCTHCIRDIIQNISEILISATDLFPILDTEITIKY